MRKLCLLLVSGAAVIAAPAHAATWTNVESAIVMKSENGVRVYRGAASAPTLEGDAVMNAQPIVSREISVKVRCAPAGYPARRLTTHGFLGVKRYYAVLGQRSFN